MGRVQHERRAQRSLPVREGAREAHPRGHLRQEHRPAVPRRLPRDEPQVQVLPLVRELELPPVHHREARHERSQVRPFPQSPYSSHLILQ